MKWFILLLLMWACSGCGGYAPMSAARAQQNSDGWQAERDRRMSDQWQTWQIQNQQQTQQQNQDWWKNKK